MLLKWFDSHILNIITGIICAILGYFTPITGVLSVVTGAILLDLFVGVMAAIKRKRPVESNKLWRTIKKLLYSVLLIALIYAVDTELSVITLHKIVAWFICGFELWSILESMAYLVDHPIFDLLRQFMKDKIESQTGIDISDNG